MNLVDLMARDYSNGKDNVGQMLSAEVPSDGEVDAREAGWEVSRQISEGDTSQMGVAAAQLCVLTVIWAWGLCVARSTEQSQRRWKSRLLGKIS